MEVKRPTYKLKWKKNLWTVEGPQTKEKNSNYHQALNYARQCAQRASGEVHIYLETGELKEIVKCY